MKEWVVGMDGSRACETALAWAIDEAAQRGDAVTAVAVVADSAAAHPRGPGAVTEPLSWHGPRTVREAEALLEAAVAAHADSDVSLRTEVVAADAVAPALVGRAARARALVVGTGWRGALQSVVAGSVRRQVLDQATLPVVVVPQRPSGGESHRAVIVGVDESPEALAALRAGAEMARIHDCALELVTVQPPPAGGEHLPVRSAMDAYLWTGMPASSVRTLAVDAEREREQAYAHWRATGEQVVDRQLARVDAATLPDKVTISVVAGRHPARNLIEAAGWAILLVVGRGSGPSVHGLRLGSVSGQCARRAGVPVMVVPPA